MVIALDGVLRLKGIPSKRSNGEAQLLRSEGERTLPFVVASAPQPRALLARRSPWAKLLLLTIYGLLFNLFSLLSSSGPLMHLKKAQIQRDEIQIFLNRHHDRLTSESL